METGAGSGNAGQENRNRKFGISETKQCGWIHINNGREWISKIRNPDPCNHFKVQTCTSTQWIKKIHQYNTCKQVTTRQQ
jgi:hypothetical protein